VLVAEVRPLREVRLPEHDRARCAQPGDDEGVAWGRRAGEGERPGGGQHAIAGCDVVFDEDGDAVQRTARAPGFPLGIQTVGVLQRVRIDLDHAPDRGSLPIDRLDSREVLLDERAGRVPSGLHSLLEIRNRCLFDIERGWRDHPGRGCRPAHDGESRARQDQGSQRGDAARRPAH
jgi:hypothetical protein